MVIDTSAFLAILQDEPDRRSFTEAIAAAVVRRAWTSSCRRRRKRDGRHRDRIDRDVIARSRE